ncbi:cytochrome c-type biogenesis protein [Salinimonas iocasae]|uniref:Cytochrome c-type biogenesis protein n=1 Tax=Salinimonas iocasae TaxID=2572577 RepID=A0A5B7YF23_9ALTE|nr:cytochrome c-type biogenesis protein [Salinimonas iocasae]QCZ94352.1 cytochrome c-type biogenesis protein CcmH [Salinimonas iocasae]
MIRLWIIALIFVSSMSLAAQNSYEFDSEAQRESFNRLTAVLRCPMCQNQNIADSDAMIAHDMRRKVHQLLQKGKTEAEIIAYMKARYGDFVYYEPPVTLGTIWLWLIPLIFIACASIIVVKRRKPQVSPDMAEKLARADEILKQDKS